MNAYYSLLRKYWMVVADNARLRLELQRVKRERSESLTQMLKGEALRDKMFLHAILAGAYSNKEDEG